MLPSIIAQSSPETSEVEARLRAMTRLVAAVQELSLSRSLDAVIKTARTVARELTGADGATLILRDGDQCHYVDEDAIGPLWKGQRFPMSACVSGWSMIHHQPAVIPDIFDDPRVPVDAYRPTFVKSLVMVPIRTSEPIGAIGTYWARPHRAPAHEVELLQTLANTTSVALENVRVYEELERRVEARTRELRTANEELEAFSYSVSHDLRNPLTVINGFTGLVEKALGSHADANICDYLTTIREETARMEQLIQDLLRMAALNRAELRTAPVNLSKLAREIVGRLRSSEPQRNVEVQIEPALMVQADQGLLHATLENLLSNAWKYTSRREHAQIEIGRGAGADGSDVFFIRDNGAGFDMRYASQLFTPFKRLHARTAFPGTGVGLATVRRIIERHGGRIWAEAAVDQGATFFFTLPRNDPTAPG